MSVLKELYTEIDELTEEISAKVSGQLPTWLKGTLVRNGPGLFHIGEYNLNHWFDGLALLHRFTISDGHVAYCNKFLRSEAYVEGLKQKRIVKTEFGTSETPDPCKAIFSRFFSYFNFADISSQTDNCLVNIIPIKGKQYAASETCKIIEIDPDTLDVLGTVDIGKEFPGNVELFGATAHPHIGSDGTVYNISMIYGKNTSYNITSIPPKSTDENEKPLDGGTIIASIPPTTWKPAYFHSFGITENYFIVSENPFSANVIYMVIRRFMGWSFAECFSWDPTMDSKFHVVDRKSGQVVTTYTCKATFIFHHVNAFEKDGNIVMDACCYDDGNVVYSFYLKAIHCEDEAKAKFSCPPQLRRYLLPLKKSADGNIPRHQELPVGSYGLDHEVLYPYLELPRINYDKYNSKEYRYVYGVRAEEGKTFPFEQIVKVDIKTKEAKIWKEKNCYPSEPVFVPSPDARDEDMGVVLSAVLNVETKASFLLVLDGTTFEELARADVPVVIPSHLHGIFLEK